MGINCPGIDQRADSFILACVRKTAPPGRGRGRRGLAFHVGLVALDAGHRQRRDALATAQETHLFVRGRLDADPAGRQAQAFGQPRAHGFQVRRDLGRFGDQGRVDVDDARAAAFEDVRHAREDVRAGDALDGGVRVGKMVADVGGGDRAQQRVGDGVDEHVGVRMAFESLGMRDLDPAEKERPAFREGMNVVTDTGKGAAGHGEGAWQTLTSEPNRARTGKGTEKSAGLTNRR